MTTKVRGVQSIEVASRLLSVFLDTTRPLRLRDLSEGSGLPSAQIHAYMVSFQALGMVELDLEKHLYRLGPAARELGLARMHQLDPLSLAFTGATNLARNSGFSVLVAVWGSFGPTVLYVPEGRVQLNMNTRAGTVYAVTGTATGMVFAAYLPEQTIRRAILAERRENKHRMRVGLSKPFNAVKPMLEDVRRQGYAMTVDNPIPGIAAMGSPIFDFTGQLRAVVTMIGATADFSDPVRQAALEQLTAVTSGLSHQLGFVSA
ncbi:MAG: IclR family transcriptional regulator [Mesorhizobium sp.]|nr:MAG: IclR family transcriptional regulator [Mesorhizobium sp.]